MSDRREPMGMVEIVQARLGDRFEDLYAALLRTLPNCSNCRRLSIFIMKDYPQRPATYSCGFTDDPECMGVGEDVEWLDTDWKWHVVAARASRKPGSAMP